MATNNISKPSNRYYQLEKKRELSRHLMGGTEAMIAAGELFMPRHPAEDIENYRVRLRSTTLYGAYASTVMKMSGKVFSKPVIINKDVPPQIALLTEDIDCQGRSLTSFLLDVFINGVADGISFIYVDYTAIKPEDENQLITKLDALELGARSFCISYDASQIIDWKSESINGEHVLTMVRIQEFISEQSEDDEFVNVDLEQIRVLRPGSFEIWRRIANTGANASNNVFSTSSTANDWYLYDSGQTKVSYIPLVPFYTNRTGFFEGLPPLQALADLSKQHWNSSSEQVQALTFARFAMMVFSGIGEDESIGKVGPNQIIKLSSPEAKWGLIETAGKGIEQGRQDIEDIEKRMLSSGMTARVELKSHTTATASAIDSADADSVLIAWATAMEDAVNQVFWFMADYEGLPDGGTVEINKAFSTQRPEGNANDLLAIYTNHGISHATYLDELKRRNIINDSIKVEAEIAKVKKEMPKEPKYNKQPNNINPMSIKIDDVEEK